MTHPARSNTETNTMRDYDRGYATGLQHAFRIATGIVETQGFYPDTVKGMRQAWVKERIVERISDAAAFFPSGALLPTPVPVAGGEPKQEAGSELYCGDCEKRTKARMRGHRVTCAVCGWYDVMPEVASRIMETAPADSAEVSAASEDAIRLAWKRLRAGGRFSLFATPEVAATTAASVVSVFSSRPASPPPPSSSETALAEMKRERDELRHTLSAQEGRTREGYMTASDARAETERALTERDEARRERDEADRLMLHWRDIALTPPLLAMQTERDAARADVAMLAEALEWIQNAPDMHGEETTIGMLVKAATIALAALSTGTEGAT